MTGYDRAVIDAIVPDIVAVADPAKLLVMGICGAQGSGKSTLSAQIERELGRAGLPAAVISIDDLYKTRAERARLAVSVHPLLGTRGVPGTHDVALGLDLIAALEQGRRAAMPRFDKARDDRLPPETWPTAGPGLRVLILEGWFVGARPQPEAALREPVNALEQAEDRDGLWRRYANRALAGEYQDLFDRMDLLLLLAAPGWDVISGWRIEQEHRLVAAGGTGAGIMDDAAIARFVQHYERLTRHILAEMPARANIVAALAADRSVQNLSRRPRKAQGHAGTAL